MTRVVLILCLVAAVASCGEEGFTAPVASTAAPSTGLPDTTAPQAGHVEAWQQVADDLRDLQHGLERPEHLIAAEPVLDGSEFDVERYFDVLTHIDVEPGFVLDYVYRTSPDRGFPVLYTRRSDAERYLTYAQFEAGTGRDAGQGDLAFMEQVYVVDGTPQGFFEYVVLETVGGQFYLFWHAQEEDDRIIATEERLDEALASVATEMDAEELARARTVDPTPVVILDDDVATVEVVKFTRRGGLYRVTYTIERVFPQRILDRSAESLGYCDCGLTM